MDARCFLPFRYDSETKQFVPELYTNVAENTLLNNPDFPDVYSVDEALSLLMGKSGNIAVNNTLTSESETEALSAAQGKILNESKAVTVTYTATIPTVGWSADTPSVVSVEVGGMLASDTPIVDVILTGTASTDTARLEAWGRIGRITTSADSITIYCYDGTPSAAIPIQLKVVR